MPQDTILLPSSAVAIVGADEVLPCDVIQLSSGIFLVEESSQMRPPAALRHSLWEQAHSSVLIQAWARERSFTAAQQASMSEFRERLLAVGLLSPRWDHLPTFYRFCQARQYNVDKALEMFSNHMAFRKKWQLDELEDTREFGRIQQFVYESKFPMKPAIKAAYPSVHHKVDKQGRIIFIDRVGKLDMAALSRAATDEQLLRLFVWDFEASMQFRLPASTMACGRYISQGVVIVDLLGAKISNFDHAQRTWLRQVSAISQDNYPEMLGRLFVINAPVTFTIVWKFIRPLLDKRTRDKVSILGSSYTSELLEHIDVEDLPTFLGGKDESCDFVSEKGPWATQMPQNGDRKGQ